MKIFHVIAKANNGGAQAHVQSLALGTKAAGHEVVVATGEAGWLTDEMRSAGVPVEILGGLKRTWNPLPVVRFIWELRRLLRVHRPAVVHFHSSNSIVGTLAVRAIGRNRPRAIATIHGLSVLSPGWRRSEFIRWCYRMAMALFLRFAERVVFVCETDRKLGLTQGLGRESQAEVVNNGIDVDLARLPRLEAQEALFAADPAALSRLHTDDFVVGAIARLDYQKHLELLVEAATKSRRSRNVCRYVIVGAGPYEMRLRRLAVENGVNEDVIFAGNVRDAKRYLMAFDCFALTSRYEGLPYSILEAGAAGIPVVATDVGGVSEVITHGVTGRLVPGGDANALAREIEWVRTHRAAAEVQAAAAREKIVKEFSEKEMIRRILKIYQEVVA